MWYICAFTVMCTQACMWIGQGWLSSVFYLSTLQFLIKSCWLTWRLAYKTNPWDVPVSIAKTKGPTGVSSFTWIWGSETMSFFSHIKHVVVWTVYSALQQRLLSQSYMLPPVVKMSIVMRCLVTSITTALVLWGPQIGGKDWLGGDPWRKLPGSQVRENHQKPKGWMEMPWRNCGQ